MDSANTPMGSALTDTNTDEREAHSYPLNIKLRIEPPVMDSSVEPGFNSLSPATRPTPPALARPVSPAPARLVPRAVSGASRGTEPAEVRASVRTAAGRARARVSRRKRPVPSPPALGEDPPWAPLPLPPEMMAVLDMPTPPPYEADADKFSFSFGGATKGEERAKKRRRRAGKRKYRAA